MKKTILVTLAIASMMSCSNEEVIDSQAKQAITFDNAFVEKAPGTRAAYDGSYTTNSLTQFQVYATVTNISGATGRVFTGDVVSYNETSGKWTYTCPTQYWVPGNTYDFWAITDGNVEGATSVDVTEKFVPTTIHVLDASKQKDVLFATRSYPNYQTIDGTTVAFTLHHLLAKAKFTVKNTIDTDNGYNYVVSGIQINTDKKGIYDVANKTWSLAEDSESYELLFGNAVSQGTAEGAAAVAIGFNSKAESNYDRLLIPNEHFTEGASKKLTVTFTCQTRIGETVLRTETKTVTTEKDVVLVQGRAYNFIISLGNPGEKIQFTVNEVKNWETNHTGYNPGTEIK